MREIKTEIEILAPAAKVWDILADFGAWEEWNPIVDRVSGTASLGSRLEVTMCGKNGKAGPKFKPYLTVFEKPKSFRWRGKMMAESLFTNDKVLELVENGSGTRLIHKEMFSGLLAPLFWGKLNRFVPPMLQSMNEALKKRAEK